MIDSVSIKIRSGDGGDGAISGRREKYVPLGGPDGGNGGDGGDIRIVCDTSTKTLASYRYRRRFVAGNGTNGSGRKKHGARGQDVELRVPEGTVVTLVGSLETLDVADLDTPGQEVIIAGGQGGRGNAKFATSTNRYPRLAEQGEHGREFTAQFDLKLIADVGIIGQPNAGKSSLLAALTAAQPKIAAYPFSTLEPVLGVVEVGEQRAVLVDIPGLIEGAHAGVGLGHEFLRHIERARVLVHVVDGSLDDPAAEYQRVREELVQYGEGVPAKREIVALNKCDIAGVEERADGLRSIVEGKPVHVISAVAHIGLSPLMDDVFATLLSLDEEEHATPRESAERVVLRPSPADEGVTVDRNGTGYRINAGRLGRLAAMVDPADWEARAQLYGYLERAGIFVALQRAGAGPGDPFELGGKEWSWE